VEGGCPHPVEIKVQFVVDDPLPEGEGKIFRMEGKYD